MKLKNLLTILSVLFCFSALPQAHLQALKGNAELITKSRTQKALTQKAQSVTAAFLPFADDFSYFGPYPDGARWENSNSVYVNRTKATKPITIGVATLDGLNKYGLPYQPAALGGSFPSDTLTSIPLRLDSLNGLNILPSDSVTLRFYYQARGYWEAPDNNEDLILDFYNPSTNSWDLNKWSKGGYNPMTDSSFHRVMIAITDTAYLKNGFRFRFRNMSTGCGDVDHWHLDAFYMDKKLNPNRDTIVEEISFAFDMKSILKNYSQMPYEQFTGAADMRTDINEYYNLRNNYVNGVNLTTYYQIRDNVGNVIAQNTNGTNNVGPFGTSGYCSDPFLINPSLNNFIYNGGSAFTDSTSYLLKFYATNISDNYHANDTIYYRQKFHNYFSYDDGTAEAGFGVTATNGQVAVRYKLNNADTLRSIDVFFDPVQNVPLLKNSNIRFFVASDNGGIPNAYLLVDSATVPYYDSAYDRFQRYQLSKSIPLAAGQTFYIGVIQTPSLSLNIGYDLNTDTRTEVLFSPGTGWYVSSYSGSLMMHPVFGDSSRAVNVHYLATGKEEGALLYPNPAQDEVWINTQKESRLIQLCDMLGNVLIEQKENRINTAALPPGLYLVKVIGTDGICNTRKLLIAR